ncbi:aspartate 1-decarboxylase [bacterium]|nr:aspartate 1-decarboxylase [bacterium]
MRLTMCKCKLHRATITQARLDYEGSITIDEELLDASGILPFEKVQVVNLNTGARFETYTYAGEPGSRMICLNGAAARLAQIGDKVIIIAYCDMEAEEARRHKPRLVLLDDDNDIREIINEIPQPVPRDRDHEC